MNYAKIIPFDLSNGEGIRVSLFVSGCNFHCLDCFNQECQAFDCGKPYTIETRDKILKLVSNPYVAGLSILGGDPLWQTKDDMNFYLDVLVSKVHELNKTVWLWSGFAWEEIMGNIWQLDTSFEAKQTMFARQQLVTDCDVFVDGRYDKNLKDLTLKWCGSSNQRVIDVQKSIAAKQVILYGEDN